MSKPLPDRAKKRLRIAAGLLRGPGRRPRELAVSRENFYEDLQKIIAELPEDERAALKDAADWVESYVQEEEHSWPEQARKGKRS